MPTTRKKQASERKKRALELHARGFGPTAISKELGITVRHASRLIETTPDESPVGVVKAPWSTPGRAQKPPARPAPKDGLIVYMKPGENERYPNGAVCLDAVAMKRAIGITTEAMLRWHLAALYVTGWLDAESDRPEKWVTIAPGIRERLYIVIGHRAPIDVRATCYELRHDAKRHANTARHRDGGVVDLPPYPGSDYPVGELAFPIMFFS